MVDGVRRENIVQSLVRTLSINLSDKFLSLSLSLSKRKSVEYNKLAEIKYKVWKKTFPVSLLP